MSLGTLAAETMSPATLKGMITKMFKEERLVPPLRLEDDAYVRASGMAYLCPREEVICNILNVETRKSKFPADSMLTLTHGTALHWALQNKILPELGVLLGQWSCIGCGTVYGVSNGSQALSEFLIKRPDSCTKPGCDSKEFQYCELHFKDETYRIGGHPDGFLSIPGMPGLGLLEAKSASSENAYKAETSPFMEHIVQINIYMWLTRLNWAKFLYWDKGGRGVSALIEHTVYRDDELINEIKKTLKSIWDGIETKTLPDKFTGLCTDHRCTCAKGHSLCGDRKCTRAKKCQVADICFANTNKILV